MKALLLAAGVGGRLRPKTGYVLNYLALIRGVPLLDIWPTKLSSAGVGRFLVNTFHLVVESFFSTLKIERVNRRGRYKTRKEAKTDIFDFIECF